MEIVGELTLSTRDPSMESLLSASGSGRPTAGIDQPRMGGAKRTFRV
jgi:hypothetical protein